MIFRQHSKSKRQSEFYKTFLIVGIPLMIQQFVSSSLNFIDNLMIGRLGTNYIAAVGFANNVYRIYDLCLFGIYSGMGIFIAQYYGKRDFKIIKQIFGMMVRVGFLIGLLFSTGAYMFAENILSVYTRDPEVLKIGVSYLRRAVFCYNFYSLSFAIGFTFRAMGQTKVPMIASATGVIINTIFNYFLIYGNGGFPKLEEKGAATATIIARIVELTMFILIVSIKDYNLKGKLKEYLNISSELIKEIIKRTIPVFFTELLWILGTIGLTVAYARLGTKSSAAIQISEVVNALAAIVFMGISNAAAVIIGHTIGQGNIKKVKEYSKKILKVAIIMAMISVVTIQSSAHLIVKLYGLPDDVAALALQAMRIFGFVVFFKMINWSILIGLFRAGGDTKIAFLADTVPLWCFAVPIAFLGTYLKLPLYQVVILAEFSEVIKLGIGIFRYKSMKWIKDVTI
ncbi:MATE family efflux transporter [Fusobacterium sp. PH5-44]|uniref:MATE family efflux transporter n=1 Tax=unclassified Fusobacterium TaxID=2648384 RepID=UPI003D1D9E4C